MGVQLNYPISCVVIVYIKYQECVEFVLFGVGLNAVSDIREVSCICFFLFGVSGRLGSRIGVIM